MAVSEVCGHLRSLTQKLSSLQGPKTYPVSYKTERVRQNLRLDLPSLQGPSCGSFTDGSGYPSRFPKPRGPNVSQTRESLFRNRINPILPELEKLADSAASDEISVVQAATFNYLGRLQKVWGHEGNLTTIDHCNVNNSASSVPTQLCRYVNLRAFLRFGLLPKADRRYKLTITKIDDLVDSMVKEKRRPGTAWRLVAEIWKDVRSQIRTGRVKLRLKTPYTDGDINFIGHGTPALHQNASLPLASRQMLKHIIRELALPGWETPKDRTQNLGLVAVQVPSAGLRLFRPTILDNFGLYSYFFLPGIPRNSFGLTWPLTNSLQYNSRRRHQGQPEWTVLVKGRGPQAGISCVHSIRGRPSPSFQIAGLAFSEAHAELFQE